MKKKNRPSGTAKTRSTEGYWLNAIKRFFKEKPLGVFGFAVIVVMILVAIFADVIAPYGIDEIDLMNRLANESAAHIMGTDNLGRDTFTWIVYGARISVVVGFGATLLQMVVSVLIGMTSGYYGGKADLIIQRIVDGIMCIPVMLILIMVMSIIGTGVPQMIVAIGIPSGIMQSRMVRSAVISIKGSTYIDASKTVGNRHIGVMVKHVLPNIAPVIIMNACSQLGACIMMEASLSFLGYGVSIGVPSWGTMLSLDGRAHMLSRPMLAIWPGLVISIVLFSMAVFGDAVRDLLDPRLEGGSSTYSLRTKIRGWERRIAEYKSRYASN